MHAAIHAPLLMLLLGSVPAPPTAAVEAPDISAAINWRIGFIPAERLMVDICAIEARSSAETVAEVMQRVRAASFLTCGTKPGKEATVWKLSGIAEWEGGRRVDLAVDITTARTTHREHYMIEDGEVKQVTLSAFGHYD